MKVLKFIKSILKDFIYGVFIRLVIVAGILLIAMIGSIVIMAIPTLVCLLTKDIDMFKYCMIAELIFLIVYAFIYENRRNIKWYLKSKWTELDK